MRTDIVKGKRGMSLAVALLYVAIITAAFASIINLVLSEYRATRSATAWVQALYTAEAGIDLALCELNREATGAPAWKGWTRTNTTCRLDSIPDILMQECTFQPELGVTVDTAALRISASGSVSPSTGTPSVSRNVTVTLTRQGQRYSIDTWEEK